MIRRDGLTKIPRLRASSDLFTGNPAPDDRSGLYSVDCLLRHPLSGLPPSPPLRSD